MFSKYTTNIFSMYQVGVDTSVPSRFDCEKCNGKMVPIYYIGVKGKVYEY